MSAFTVPVVVIGEVKEHPNADRLEIAMVEGDPCIIQKGSFKEGDVAIYIPEDSVVPIGTNPSLEFLAKGKDVEKVRVKAVKLRGVFSVGVLIPIPESVDCVTVGQDAATMLGIEKYEAPTPAHLGGEQDSMVDSLPRYSIDQYHKEKKLLVGGEEVHVTEKIHGTNFRVAFVDGRLRVGSRTIFWRPESDNVYWKAVRQYDLEEVMEENPGLALYGEVFGSVQDLKYGLANGAIRFAAFDLYDVRARDWCSVDELDAFCRTYNLPQVPELYRGPYSPDVVEPLAEGRSTLANHIREGIVIRRAYNNRWPRVVLKLKSEVYRLRKQGTEYH
jgi:RNA ligase (TIGR02306 family)